MSAAPKEYRTSNGIFYRVEGKGEPLLLLHGLMVSGAMFDPLVDLLRDKYRMPFRPTWPRQEQQSCWV